MDEYVAKPIKLEVLQQKLTQLFPKNLQTPQGSSESGMSYLADFST